MPRINKPAYPDELTPKFWDKEKGLLAKATKDTGIGAELTKVKADFDKIDWNKLDSDAFWKTKIKHGQRVTPDDAKQILKDYLSEIHPIFKPLETNYISLSTFLAGKAKALEGSATTKSAGKTAAKMAETAKKFSYAVAWGTISSNQQAYLVDAEKTAVATEKTWAEARSKVMPEILRAEKAVQDAMKKKLNTGDYAHLCGEYLRNIGAKLKQASATDPSLMKTFKPGLDIAAKQWAQGGFPQTDGEVPAHLKADLQLVTKFKQVAAQAGL